MEDFKLIIPPRFLGVHSIERREQIKIIINFIENCNLMPLNQNRTGKRLIGITAFNYWKIDILPAKPQKLSEALIILRIVAMQNRQQLNKLSNFKYCKHIIEKSILEN